MGIDSISQIYEMLVPFAGLILILGPLCLAFRKAGFFIGLGVGCIVNLILWSTSDKIPFLSGLVENSQIFLITAILILVIFGGIGLTAVVGLAVLSSSIGGLLLSTSLFGFNTWTIIGGFIAGLIWLYSITLFIRKIGKITEKVKEVGKKITVEYRPERRKIRHRYCPECGAEVEAGDKFCSSCGIDLGQAEEVKKVVKKK